MARAATATDRPAVEMPSISISVDAVADASLRGALSTAAEEVLYCDACDAPLWGEPEGRGLLVWFRGEDFRMEEPALCGPCATAIGIAALSQWHADEEEEG